MKARGLRLNEAKPVNAAVVTLFGAVGAVAAMLAVLVPVILTQGKSLRREIDVQGTELRREIDALRGELGGLSSELRADVTEVRRDLHALSDRVARIEGALTGPWRPTNGSPASESKPVPAAPEAST